MNRSETLDFNTVEQVLARSAVTTDAADSHGYLSGLVCAGGFTGPDQWEQELLDDEAGDEARQLLRTLYEDIQGRLNSNELDFQLLLPDDEEALQWRTEELGEWCSGFLAGLGAAGLPQSERLSTESNELLDDLAQIARIEFEADEVSEQDESAFVEIVEYVRVGVMLLNEELQPLTTPAPTQLQ